MCAAVIFVLCMSNTIISLLRHRIPNEHPHHRHADGDQQRGDPGRACSCRSLACSTLSKQLSVFVGLIVTNCIVMGRAEAFAMANRPWRSFLDGLGNALGYAWILMAVAFFRELFGSGKLLGAAASSRRAGIPTGGGWLRQQRPDGARPGSLPPARHRSSGCSAAKISGYSEAY